MLGFVTCVRNCSWRIPEWLAYHRKLGVSAFLVYNDRSTDDTSDILATSGGDVYKMETDGAGGYSESNNPEVYGQRSLVDRLARHYQKGISFLKERGCSWVGVFDVDEFVVPVATENCRAGFLPDYLSDKEDIPRIYIHSFDMKGPFSKGSAITKNNTLTWSRQTRTYAMGGKYKERGKSMINTKIWTGRAPCVHNIDNSSCLNEGESEELSREHLSKCHSLQNNLRLNHYRDPPMIDIFSDEFTNASLVL